MILAFMKTEVDKRFVHGLACTKEYAVWKTMRQRCNNPNNKDYKDYGGRGITICTSWEFFENFHRDMGLCPEGYTLDRVDFNGNYGPNNCRWATPNLQNFNQRIKSSNTSGKTGVCWHKRVGKWAVQINVKGKRISLGYFETKEEAILVRKAAEMKYYGFIKE